MKLAIHGTKDGYRILFTTNDEFALIIARDIRKGAQGDDQLGKTAYSLAFVDNGCTYSKYVIVKDSLRSFATGTIAFSLFVAVDETMKGQDILRLLNELYRSYEEKYIRNFYLNRGEKGLIKEDWSFVNDILSKYPTTPETKRHENINSGTKDPAIIYYQDDNELLEYFDKPFQTEYNDYTQILFIHSNLQGPANPINVLKNSGGKPLNIDLKNEPYYLYHYDRSNRVIITAKGEPRSEGKNNNIIRAKDWVKIIYTKDYYRPIDEKGTLSSPEIEKYLEKRGNQIFINYEALDNDIRLRPVIKIITFKIKDWEGKDWKGNSGSDAMISCENVGNEKRETNNNQITFKGEDLGKRWTVSARTNRFYSENKIIDFDKDCPGDTGSIDIFLNKHTLTINAHDGSKDGNLVFYASINKKEFINNEIREKHKIIVSHREFDPYTFYYCPEEDIDPDLLEIPLQRKTPTRKTESAHRYTVNVGKHGTWNDGSKNDRFLGGNEVSNLENLIKPHKGYRFIGLEEQGDKLVAQYVKKEYFYRNIIIIAGIFVLAVVLGFFIWTLLSSPEKGHRKQRQQPTGQQIQDYIEGNSLLLGPLNKYKGILSNESEEGLESLDNAIKKREFINALNFSELIKLDYYPAQQKFKTAIENIDSARYDEVKNRFGNVSSWSLDQIADSINAVLNTDKRAVENKGGVQEDSKKGKNEKSPIEEPQPQKPRQPKDKKPDSPPASNNTEKDITNQLQGDTVTKAKLNDWISTVKDKNKKSIELYLNFWSVVDDNKDIGAFKELLEKVKKDPALKNSELSKFLTNICDSTVVFEKYNNVSGKATCNTIADLKNRMK